MVLATLSGSSAPGYAIIEELCQRSQGVFALPEGTVYPSLHRMERAGLLASERAEAAGRRRHIYRLADRGREALCRASFVLKNPRPRRRPSAGRANMTDTSRRR